MNGREQVPPDLKPGWWGGIPKAREQGKTRGDLIKTIILVRSASELFDSCRNADTFFSYFGYVDEIHQSGCKFRKSHQFDLAEWVDRRLLGLAGRGEEMAHLVLAGEFLSEKTQYFDRLKAVIFYYDTLRVWGCQRDERGFTVFNEATKNWSKCVGSDLKQIAKVISSGKLPFTDGDYDRQLVIKFISNWNDLFYPRGKNRSDPIWGRYGIDEDETLRKGADALLLALRVLDRKQGQAHVWDVLVSDQSKVPLYKGSLETKEIKDPLPQAIREFVERRGRIIDFFRGGQSWVCQVELPNNQGIAAVTVFTENVSSQVGLTPVNVMTRINNRLEKAKTVTRMADSLLEKPGVAKVQRIIETGQYLRHGFVYVVSEWIEGKTLVEQMKERSFSDNEAMKITLQVARTAELGYQNYRLIFPDLTPENIIANGNGGLTLIDCLDCIVEGEPNHKLGKPAFAAPEQGGKNVRLDSKAMVYQLGVLLYFLRTKKGQAGQVSGDDFRPYYLSPKFEDRFPGLEETSPVREIVMGCTRRLVDERLSLYALISKLEALTRPPADEVFQ